MCARRAGFLTAADEAEHDAVLLAFAQRLRAVRKMTELTQEQLDARAYMQHGEVSKIERGQRAPGLFTLLRLAEGLCVDPGALVDGLPVPQRAASLERALALIEANPGITTGSIAKNLQVPRPPNYALRLVRKLAVSGVISNERSGWQATRRR
jgi:transcriptional regulator with XRE-family HTH domain